MNNVLIVEDEISIVKMVSYDLKSLGLNVEYAQDGESGLAMALKRDYDIILLDLMLPKLSGLDVCRQLRKANHPAHIIMLTAMDEEFNLVEGFDVGADDYVTKPFSPRELTARIKAVLRRQSKGEDATITTLDNLKVDTHRYEVFLDDKRIDLTLKEFELLDYMVKNNGQALSREQLLTKVWGYSYDGDTRVVDVHIFKLREKIDPDQKRIKTLRGIGYKML